jgi:hypothetical protein
MSKPRSFLFTIVSPVYLLALNTASSRAVASVPALQSAKPSTAWHLRNMYASGFDEFSGLDEGKKRTDCIICSMPVQSTCCTLQHCSNMSH